MKSKEKKLFFLILLIAILVRGLTLLTPELWSDETNVGLMSLRVMNGEFPVFFYGQAFMGSLEAYLAGALFLLTGATPFALELLPVLLSLIFLFLLFVLARNYFGSLVARYSILLLALPPLFFLRWVHEARPHYPLTLVFGTLLLLLSHQVIYRKSSPSKKTLLYLTMGVIGGVGWWTNYLIITFILPVAFFLFLDNKKIVFSLNCFFSLFFFVIGSSPLWVYNVTHHFPIAGITNPGALANLLPYLKDFFTNAFPILLGFLPPLTENKGDLIGYLIIGPIYLLAFFYYLFIFRKNLRSASTLGLNRDFSGDLLIHVFLLNLFLHLATNYGSRLSDNDQKYFLPFYVCFPVFVSLFLANLNKKQAVLSRLLLALILISNLIGLVRHDGWTVLNVGKYKTYQDQQASEDRLIRFLTQNRYDRFYYGVPGKTLTFKSKEALIASDLYQEGYPKYADQVDSSRRLAYLSQGESEVFEDNIKAIGGSFKKIKAGDGYLLYTAFHPPAESFQPIPRHLWTGTSDLYPMDVKNAFDGDIATGWGTRGPQKQGTYFLIDLGKVATVGKIAYIPANYREVPVGYEVSLSLDGRTWQTVSKVPEYHGPTFWSGPNPLTKVRQGRIETVFPAQPCRFVKISLLQDSNGNAWSINELFLFSPDDHSKKGASPIPTEGDITQLLNFFQEQGIHFVYADHWLSAEIRVKSGWKIQTPPSNLFTGENGEDDPPADTFTPARLDRGVALAVKQEDKELEHLLGECRQAYRQTMIGPLVIYYDFPGSSPPRPLIKTDWEVTSNVNPRDAGKALDGNPATRWTTGKSQEPGIYFQIDFKQTLTVRGCALSLGKSPNDYPRSLKLLASLDRETWREIKTTAESGLYWTGETLLKMTGTRFFFSPVQMRYLRLLQEGRDPTNYWSIHELQLF